MRLFRAQARYERWGWRRLAAGTPRRITVAEVSDRAGEISKLYVEVRLVENEAYKLQERMERILAQLIRARAREEGLEIRGWGRTPDLR